MLLSLLPGAALADAPTSGSCGKSMTWHYDKNSGILTVSGSGAMEGCPWSAFKDDMLSARIGEGVTSISGEAFTGCQKLRTVELPEGLVKISAFAFAGSAKLLSVVLPESLTEIGEYGFFGCTSLTDVYLPAGLKSIGGSAFGNCLKLERIDVAEGNESFASEDGVMFCKDMTELIQYPAGRVGSYMIPDSVTSIGDHSFFNCRRLDFIYIPDSVTSIKAAALRDCTGLTDLRIPDSVTEIGADAFFGCNGLLRVILPSGISSISDGAFFGCDSLSSVTVPDGVTSIGASAFYGCYALVSIVLPASVTSIGSHAFDYCGSLGAVNFCGTQEQWAQVERTDAGLDGLDANYNYIPHVHSFVTTVTPPTCTEYGCTDGVCECGYRFHSIGTRPLGHSVENCKCTRCGALISPFYDVSSDNYYFEPVIWAVQNKITGGKTATMFDPGAICTRAQLLTFLWRSQGCPEIAVYANPFFDLDESAYYYKAVLWAAEEGITGGFADGSFRPDEKVTRAQAMTFLWRAQHKPAAPDGTINGFGDISESAYYHDAVLWAVGNGITSGYNAQCFAPADGCTRAQIVTFLYRLMA